MLEPVLPSILSAPSLRLYLIARYGEIADTERELGRPQQERDARDNVARLSAENPLTIAKMLEA